MAMPLLTSSFVKYVCVPTFFTGNLMQFGIHCDDLFPKQTIDVNVMHSMCDWPRPRRSLLLWAEVTYETRECRKLPEFWGKRGVKSVGTD